MESSVNAILVFVILLVIGTFAIVVVLSRLAKTIERTGHLLSEAVKSLEEKTTENLKQIQTGVENTGRLFTGAVKSFEEKTTGNLKQIQIGLEQLNDVALGTQQTLKQLNEIIQTDIQSGPDITRLRRTEE